MWASLAARGYALGRDPGLCAGLWSGRSGALRPPFFLFPGGGRQLLFLRSPFPVPCAFSRLSLHLPPTLPQIYSSTLGELGRHPASPIGLLSNWCTHRPAPGGEVGRREGSGRARPGRPGIGCALPHVTSLPPPRCCRDPDTDCPQTLLHFSILPPLGSRSRG